MNSNYDIIHADFVKWLGGNQWQAQNGYIEKYHAVLADPPYFLDSINKRFGKPGSVEAQYGRDGSFQRLGKGFMGKQWDGFDNVWEYQAWVTEWASMLLDFVHPGGVLMMFGGTRTYHRLVAGLEDAGWEIYDSIISWTYGSGFPKSHDISKGIDKAAGVEREVVGSYNVHRDNSIRKPNVYEGIAGIGKHGLAGKKGGGLTPITAPTTPEASQWQGYGTALKPSFEPIVLARKPRGGLTYAECALQFGSGALNIDGARIGVAEDEPNKRRETGYEVIPSNGIYGHGLNLSKRPATLETGRWPSNTILIHHPDCVDNECVEACHVRVLGEMSGELTSGELMGNYRGGYFAPDTADKNYKSNSGTAARFFYQAKSPNWERDAGLDSDLVTVTDGRMKSIDNAYQRGETLRRNSHPTLKPIQLTEYLAKLLLPPIDNSRLLVPFAGSGSEMIGAMLAKWSHVTGIEMTDEYIPIAKARLKWWSSFDSYEAAKVSATSAARGQAIEEKKKASGQLSLFDLL